MPTVYKKGQERFVYPIDLKASLEDGWNLNPDSEDAAELISSQALIDINSASLEQLRSLPNIGVKKAQDIINGRPYQSPLDLEKLALGVDISNFITFGKYEIPKTEEA